VSDSTHHAYWCARVQTKKQSRKKMCFQYPWQGEGQRKRKKRKQKQPFCWHVFNPC